jgi:UDP-N-acetylglucosamine 1-carboxyvinyltransferase
MEVLRVRGGKTLEGSIRVAGAKNAITKLLVASLLSDKRCVFHNVPAIQEVEVTAKLCQELGMEMSWDRDAGVMQVQTPELKTSYIPQRFSGANRIPILMIGALLGRSKEDIIVPTVGGCKIGKRPVDFHIAALQELGAVIEYRGMRKEGAYFAQAHQGLHGAVIHLPYPSVGATENTLLAAVRAQGQTVIHNAAMEPEIVDLILFLQKIGAHISLDSDRTIRVQGVQDFHEVEHWVIPDRIVAASLGLAAVATKGQVFVEGARHVDMVSFLNVLREVGGGFSIRDDGIDFYYERPLRGGLHLETDVHPGFMTDWQQPFVVLLTQTEGISIVHETVYEKRFGYTETLKAMGAHIHSFKQCLGAKPCRFHGQNHQHSITVNGPTPLKGGHITIPDLRAGFAYVMAALIADGESIIEGLPYLDRGYAHLVPGLAALGADIERLQISETESLGQLNLDHAILSAPTTVAP